MISQGNYALDLVGLDGFIALIIIFFHLLVMIVLYIKIRRWILISFGALFSVIICVGSFGYEIPLTPYIQILDISISFLLMLVTSMEAFK